MTLVRYDASISSKAARGWQYWTAGGQPSVSIRSKGARQHWVAGGQPQPSVSVHTLGN